ncbi:MAG: hypothetical protein K8S62_06825 [Candidatus Sabulitectum sp.]|nr:hypothetical protein [Candidatus Sabulitectum sp.]
MKYTLVCLALLHAIASAGYVPVGLASGYETDADWLRYDDGTPAWITWEGAYRGVWFNLEDFTPGLSEIEIEEAELWFYHQSVITGWDTSSFYFEIWNGALAPAALLDQTTVTALHYAPAFVFYPTSILAENNFWCITNTALSSGGWPSNLSDGISPGVIYHSFHSDDFIDWEPWDMNGACNYFVAIRGWPPDGLNALTWGALKTTF